MGLQSQQYLTGKIPQSADVQTSGTADETLETAESAAAAALLDVARDSEEPQSKCNNFAHTKPKELRKVANDAEER